jgi:FkbM family methyltransferase
MPYPARPWVILDVRRIRGKEVPMTNFPLFKTLKFIAGHPLSRQRKSRAIRGYLKYQIGIRLVPGPIVFPWVDGARLIVHRGETGVTGNVYTGLHEFADMAYLLNVLSPSDLFIDVGANVGSYTVLACAARGARGYCFEPVPSTYNRLLSNLAINNLASRVTALNIGLADTEGELRFTSAQDTMNHVVASGEQNPNTIGVPVRPLDAILQNESPALMKIDAERFETPFIQGAEQTLANPSLHSIVMELNGAGSRYGFDETKILETLARHGFAPYAYEPFSRKLQPLTGKNNASGNTLFLRNLDHIQTRIQAAPPVVIGSISF